jgi:proton-coupled amino acid transporter
MKDPHKFPMALSGVMIFLLGNYLFLLLFECIDENFFVVLFGGSGILAYLTFGSDIQTVVLVNLDTSSKMVQSVRHS